MRKTSALSERQKEVCCLLAQGLLWKEAGERLGISPKTICNHWTRAKHKLNLRDQYQLTHYALAHGWIKNIYADEPNG